MAGNLGKPKRNWNSRRFLIQMQYRQARRETGKQYPLLLIILVVFIFLAIVAYVAFERSNNQLSLPKRKRIVLQKEKSLRNADGQ